MSAEWEAFILLNPKPNLQWRTARDGMPAAAVTDFEFQMKSKTAAVALELLFYWKVRELTLLFPQMVTAALSHDLRIIPEPKLITVGIVQQAAEEFLAEPRLQLVA